MSDRKIMILPHCVIALLNDVHCRIKVTFRHRRDDLEIEVSNVESDVLRTDNSPLSRDYYYWV